MIKVTITIEVSSIKIKPMGSQDTRDICLDQIRKAVLCMAGLELPAEAMFRTEPEITITGE